MYFCNVVSHTILLQALCIILCGGGIPCIAMGWVRSSSQGCQHYHPSANPGLKVSEESSQLRNPIVTHSFAPFVLMHLSELSHEKPLFLHVLPWSLGVLIFYITQGTILLLIWPMSKHVIKDLMKISISWRPNRFIGCLSMICYWNYPGQSMGMWFVLLWQNYHCITAPPDKDTPQLCIT